MTEQIDLAGLPADLRYAIQLSPRAYRARLAALSMLHQEITGVVHECTDAGVAEVKLRWWEEEIALMLDGKGRHPMARAFYSECADLNLPRRPFVELIDGVRQDIHAPAFAAFSDVERYCDRRGAFVELTARIHGAESSEASVQARRLGSIWQLASIVTRSGADARFGRVYFAADDLRKHKLDQHIHAGIHSDAGLKALLADYAGRARQFAREADGQPTRSAHPSLTAGRILARLALARLTHLEQRDFVTGPEALELPLFTMLLTAWSAARRSYLLKT